MTSTIETEPTHSTDAFVERLFTAVLATMDVQSVYLGGRLGWYRALAAGEAPLSATPGNGWNSRPSPGC